MCMCIWSLVFLDNRYYIPKCNICLILIIDEHVFDATEYYTLLKLDFDSDILRHFNPNIKGYSTGEGWFFHENAALNQAHPGGRATRTG